MLDQETILQRLNQHRSRLAQRYPLKSIALFGSYARGKQQANSDIDLLVEFTQPVGMEIVGLAMELEEILGQRVDLVTYSAVKNRLFHYIKNELVYA